MLILLKVISIVCGGLMLGGAGTIFGLTMLSTGKRWPGFILTGVVFVCGVISIWWGVTGA